MKNPSKVLSGILAFSVYFLLIILLTSNLNHDIEIKSVHYAQKSSKAIKVSLASSLDRRNATKMKSKPKNKSPKKIKSKGTPKSKKSAKKKKVKSVSPKPSKTSKKEKPRKKIKLNTLFEKISEKKPPVKSEKKVKKSTDSNFKKKNGANQGVKNAYFSKIEGLMQSWPAQSEFAGFSAMVWLKINKDGSFIFKILSGSNNLDFNGGLIQYLQQLQRIGFDPHQNSKPYELNVEFIAKE